MRVVGKEVAVQTSRDDNDRVTLRILMTLALVVMLGTVGYVSYTVASDDGGRTGVVSPTPPTGAAGSCVDGQGGSFFEADAFDDFADARAEAEAAAGRTLPIPEPPTWAERFDAGPQTVFLTDPVDEDADPDPDTGTLFRYGDSGGSRFVVLEFNPVPACEAFAPNIDEVTSGGRTAQVSFSRFSGGRASGDEPEFRFEARVASFGADGLNIVITAEWEEDVAPPGSEQGDEIESWVRSVLAALSE